MNKKGMDVEALHYLFLGVMLLVVIGVYMLFMSMYYTGTRSVTSAHVEIVSERILFDPNGIIYENNGRAYPGTIDFDKYTTQRLEHSMNYEFGSKPAAKLELESDKIPDDRKIIYLNEGQYRRLIPTAFVEGAGRSKKISKRLPVLVNIGDEQIPAILKMTIVAVRQ